MILLPEVLDIEFKCSKCFLQMLMDLRAEQVKSTIS